ncbi:glycosyl transferase, family 2 [Psychromonas ingrahamii 37]|uniref:Glycosyl transferase, family 2 n=1 Tax=Psychromonas ingrahamii (strain DSM 17664 / CCUG 51855 / 37) TaxID=357804 RepID=A1ST11_PSYIN|nr:glycosyltransferase family 2 protein [Psychromonas ingrahamii]ABM02626.1 glycosyl transferase, family 2 [Psychromonas ingrahamii 37]
MTELVSILIPVFNRETLIEETLYSALNQTYGNIEVVVVDNCSTDRTWEVVQAVASKDSRIKCFQNKSNVGPVRNWKRCIDEATGSYGKILWSDDLIHKQFIEETLPYLKNEDVGFVYTKAEIFIDGSEIKSEHYHLGKSGLYDNEKYIEGVILGGEFPVSPGCALFRLNDLRSNLLIDIPNSVESDFSMHAIGNDLLIFLLTANSYAKFAYVDKTLSKFRSHDGSISVNSIDGKLPLHYALATAFFLENKRQDLIEKFNVLIKSCLFRYRKVNKYGMNNISDFYCINKNFRIDYSFLLIKVKNKFASFLRL